MLPAGFLNCWPAQSVCFVGMVSAVLLVGAGLVAGLAVLFLGIGHESQYVFDPKHMKEVAEKAIATHPNGNASQIIASVVAQLKVSHPRYIIDTDRWIFNNAGGAMGSMLVLHCSLSEYVIIFGTAVGTEGHTGRFLADDYFTILHGEQWAFPAGAVEREVYRPGDQHHLPRGVAKQYRMPDTCWALEYARGNILSMMPFGLFDTFFSTLDLVSLYQTVEVSLIGMASQLLIGKI
eukprot:m.28762 g.28762  ORF g.28762 m.28762 type:complete len:235 (-) comp40314_c0_seq1:29-733(-)